MIYFNYSLLILVSFIIFICLFRIFSWIKKYYYVTKFQSYISVLVYHMDKAYDMIHKDHILIYSIEATRPSDENIDKAVKEFCKLTIKFLGPMLYREMRNVYGSEDALLFTMVEYFNGQYESDEIRTASIDKLSEKENETEKT